MASCSPPAYLAPEDRSCIELTQRVVLFQDGKNRLVGLDGLFRLERGGRRADRAGVTWRRADALKDQ